MVTEEEREWMQHALLLCAKRLKKWPNHEKRAKRERVRKELEARQDVLNNLEHDLNGQAAVWCAYMVRHARLQIRRYAWELSETEFQAACKDLRLERDQDLKRFAGLPWLLLREEDKAS